MPTLRAVEGGRAQRAVRTSAPVVIEARGVEKTFRVPTHRIDTFKERVVRPFAAPDYRPLHALRGVSFDVHAGEFFGIVGRNGSGKSTLLKILASIYRADAGRIAMAGRPAPFIELGVGFNPELTARENVVLNGVMMGLSQREARRRLDTVLEFAELEEFVDLKLKNYSSGMLVRLAFSVMLQAEAEIMLIDEVLAVGDASFQQKCRDALSAMREAGRTIVLVTHDMATVQAFCHRAMLLEEGEIKYIGDPEEAGRRYLITNFERQRVTLGKTDVELVPDLLGRASEAWIENGRGERVQSVEVGERITVRALIEASRELENPGFRFHFNTDSGVVVFALRRDPVEDGSATAVPEGGLVEVSATIENPLLPGRYRLVCWIAVVRNRQKVAQQAINLFDFVVHGVGGAEGTVAVPGEMKLRVEENRGAGR
jgi:ABC-type polysaccharide/polyol phosphate transport system ATPase subunit